MQAGDTTQAAAAAQRNAYRRMGPDRRLEIACRMSEDARSIAAEGIRSRHPDYSAQQIQAALLRLVVGDDLYQRVWPDRPLLTA